MALLLASGLVELQDVSLIMADTSTRWCGLGGTHTQVWDAAGECIRESLDQLSWVLEAVRPPRRSSPRGVLPQSLCTCHTAPLRAQGFSSEKTSVG